MGRRGPRLRVTDTGNQGVESMAGVDAMFRLCFATAHDTFLSVSQGALSQAFSLPASRLWFRLSCSCTTVSTNASADRLVRR